MERDGRKGVGVGAGGTESRVRAETFKFHACLVDRLL